MTKLFSICKLLQCNNVKVLAYRPRFFSYASSISQLPSKVRDFVLEKADVCKPENIQICTGTEDENNKMIDHLVKAGSLKKLAKYENCWIARTDPRDVARSESKTVISTPNRRDTIPDPMPGVEGQLGIWMSPKDLEKAFADRFPNCMNGRTMYVIPFSMGPVGGPLSKFGIELTDSPYVVASMRIMTRMGSPVLNALGNGDFVRALHSVGQPLPMKTPPLHGWPCNPEKLLIAHIPAKNEICSFGSGYGGNSLLGKKCFALRLGSIIARDEGWLAEHMLIMGITNPQGRKHYVAAAFPSACGKTNLAMMMPTIPGFKVECVGDDIAWMKFDANGRLRAINPEAGFFGVAPKTSNSTNPNAMATIQKNTIFTNVAETSDGGFYWTGLEKEVDISPSSGRKVIDFHGKPWDPTTAKTPAAHPNSRFCTPASQCPIIDPAWESSEGVPIDAIIFGGRRPQGVPLVYESFNWQHGVLLGAGMKSEATAAAEHAAGTLMHDPFAMRPFFGYNFGHYMSHWLRLGAKPNRQLPRIYHVNWFRRAAADDSFLWPGFGENSRVLDWILRRLDGSVGAADSPIGRLPHIKDLNLNSLSLSKAQLDELFSVPVDFWREDAAELRKYFSEQVGADVPPEINEQLAQLDARLAAA